MVISRPAYGCLRDSGLKAAFPWRLRGFWGSIGSNRHPLAAYVLSDGTTSLKAAMVFSTSSSVWTREG